MRACNTAHPAAPIPAMATAGPLAKCGPADFGGLSELRQIPSHSENPSLPVNPGAGGIAATAKTSPLEGALYLAETFGFFVAPLAPMAKTPVPGRSWKTSTSDPAVVKAWAKAYPGCNWAVDCEKSGLAVIDVDRKNGVDGRETLRELKAMYGHLPPTMTSHTPSGGVHLVFTGEIPSKAGNLGKGLDTRGVGGYIVAPGSVLPNGRYELATGDLAPQPVPEWVVGLAGATREESKPQTAAVVEIDQPRHIDMARNLIKRTEGAVQGNGGDAATFKLCAKLGGLGVSRDTAFELLTADDGGGSWNDRCAPSWEFPELEAKITNAYRYRNQAPLGGETPEAVLGDFIDEGDDAPRPMAATVTSSDEVAQARRNSVPSIVLESLRAGRFLKCLPPPLVFLFAGSLLAGEVGLLVGHGGAGKGFFVLQAAAAVAGGLDGVAGVLTVAQHGPVFCMCAEDSSHVLHNRVHDVFQNATPADAFDDDAYAEVLAERINENLYVMSGVGLDVRLMEMDGGNPRPSLFFKTLLATLKTISGLRMVILEPLSRLYTGNENDNTLATYFFSLIERIAQETGATVLVAHHTNKASGSSKAGKGEKAQQQQIEGRLVQDAVRGASGFSNAVRWQMNLTTLTDDEIKSVGGDPSRSGMYLAGKVSKNNSGKPEGTFFLERGHGGVLHRFERKRQKSDLEIEAMLVEKLVEDIRQRENAGEPPVVLKTLAEGRAKLWKTEIPAATVSGIKTAAATAVLGGKLFPVRRKIANGHEVEFLATVPDAGNHA